MAKHTGLLAHHADAQVTKLFHRLHDGDWVHETIQDCDPIIEANKEAQNHCDPRSLSGDLRHTHRIPLIFFDKWLKELGIDYFNRDHEQAVERLLASSDWRWLSVDGRKNHNVSMSDIKIGRETPIFQAPKVSPGAILGSDGTPMQAVH